MLKGQPQVSDFGDDQSFQEKFQLLQEAYSRLKAELKGYTFTEEDLFNMYQNDERARQQQHAKEERDQRNMYEEDMYAKENFERWKKGQFTVYD